MNYLFRVFPISALLAMTVTQSVMADTEQGNFYLSVGYNVMEGDEPQIPPGPLYISLDKLELSSVEVALGYDLNTFLALEGRIGFSNESAEYEQRAAYDYGGDAWHSYNLNVETEVDGQYSFYLKPNYDIGNFQLYALVGLSSLKVSSSYTGTYTDSNLDWESGDYIHDVSDYSGTLSNSTLELSYGLGMGYAIAGRVLVNLEYRYFGSDLDFTGYSMNIGYRF